MTEKTLDLLEAMIEDLINRMLIVKVMGNKNIPIVEYLDAHIDEIKKKILELPIPNEGEKKQEIDD